MIYSLIYKNLYFSVLAITNCSLFILKYLNIGCKSRKAFFFMRNII